MPCSKENRHVLRNFTPSDVLANLERCLRKSVMIKSERCMKDTGDTFLCPAINTLAFEPKHLRRISHEAKYMILCYDHPP